jgi:hypothetical protein
MLKTRRCILPPNATVIGTAPAIRRQSGLTLLTAGWRPVVATHLGRRGAVALPTLRHGHPRGSASCTGLLC